MSDLSNKIIGAGLCLEGIEVEKMEKEIAALKDKIKSNKLICPHCLTEIYPVRYEGYYDGFDYWSCKCDKLPVDNKNKWFGAYCN